MSLKEFFSWRLPQHPTSVIKAYTSMLTTMSGPRVVLSTRAYADVLNETSQHPETETGGVFIGVREGDVWYVVESIDPGPRALLSRSYFEYDQGYVNHLANKVSRRYSSSLRLIGLWHRHPGSFDSFSATDDQTHLRYLRQCQEPIISVLVNIDPHFRVTPYVVDGPPILHQRAAYQVGDQHLPAHLLEPVSHEALLDRINTPSTRTHATTHSVEFVGNQRVRSVGGQESRTPLITADTFAGIGRDAGPGRHDDQDDIVNVLDSELDFLESQREFAYELEMTPRGLVLTMKRLAGGRDNEALQFRFVNENDSRLVIWEGRSYRFREGIIEQLIGERYY